MATKVKSVKKVIVPKAKIGKNFVNVASINPVKTTKMIVKPIQNPLLSSLIQEDNLTLTENLAPTYKSTLNGVLDFFSMGGALRTRSEDEIVKLFIKAFAEDQLLALKCLFDTRNIRGGKGERRTFRIILKYLGDNYPDVVEKNLENISYFGRFDDFYSLFDTKSEKFALEFIKNQLDKDVEAYNNDKPISLTSKWVSSENTSSQATRKLAHKIRTYLGWTPKQYRKTLSALRSYSNVVEVKMSNNNWTDINFSQVPSKASLNYKKAFSKHDGERYRAYIQAVKGGEAKINASALFPYEIIDKVFKGQDSQTLDVLWDALPNYMEDNERNILCVCDVSGSMMGIPMAISISLGIYTAERNKGPFANYFITYSEIPTLQKVVGKNIREKIACLSKTCAYNTDLQSVFNMLLSSAVSRKVEQKDMPEQILVITDCAFDNPQNGNTNFETIKVKYKQAGYEIPMLIFWNVNSKKNDCPALATDKGVVLVSGASPSVFKSLMSSKTVTPVMQMLETLNQPMYDRVVI